MFLKCPPVAAGWGLKVCISNKFSGAVNVVGPSAKTGEASLANESCRPNLASLLFLQPEPRVVFIFSVGWKKLKRRIIFYDL